MIKPFEGFPDEFESLEEAQAFLERAAAAYNQQPQDELGGLSPAQMHDLLQGDWFTAGPLRLNLEIVPDDVRDADLLVNARIFLTAVQEAGGVKATATGNLPRAFVALMLERLRFPAGYVEEIRRYNKTINEHDAYVLHVLRVILELAKLVRRFRGKFVLRPAGRELLAESQAGTLYVRLFRTVFREFNLAYLDGGGPESSGLQHTVAFSLYRLSTAAVEWRNPYELAAEVVLPEVYDELVDPRWDDEAAMRIEARLLRPLEWFGLLERRDLPSPNSFDRPYEVRKTVLFDRFIRFRF